MNKRFVISGIGTGVGKTVVSAIIAEHLKSGYWKPVQAGDLDQSDAITVSSLTSMVQIIEERYKLTEPMSPHAAAEIDGVMITEADLMIPDYDGDLVIEGAGGLMVPLNNNGLTYLDVFEKWKVPVILVSRHYLGSINHTLLSIDALQKRNIEIEGIVFVGEENKPTEEIILHNSGLKMICRIPEVEEVDRSFIEEQALNPALSYHFSL
jgi:dethiobiotin synthetase